MRKVKDQRWGALELGQSFLHLLHPELLSHPCPAVPRVDCVGCRRAQEGTADDHIRCCDVTPRLPNFLVGEILASGGHPQLESWIDGQRGDPYFMLVPPTVARRHIEAREGGRYGLGCPFLLEGQGRCSVYAMRPALCVGYHCYYPDQLWQEAWACLTTTLELLQDAAARYLVSRSSLQLSQMLRAWERFELELELWQGESQHPEAYALFWQEWRGREREFYEACFVQICEDPQAVRQGAGELQRQQLMSRLEAMGKLDGRAEEQLWLEVKAPASGLEPLEPRPAFRRRYRRGSVPAPSNECSLTQQQSMLLWYLHQLSEPTWWQKLSRRWSRELPVSTALEQGGEGDVKEAHLKHHQKGQ